MRIALGSDHRGENVIRTLAPALRSAGHEVAILSECNGQPCDYPDHAYRVARAVSDGQYDRGILVCGSGIGVSISANKVPGIRAALVCDEVTARLSRSHNDSNILCMGADTTPPREIANIARTWLATAFEGGRHERRVRKIGAIERGEDPATTDLDAAVG
jgi:RpiB/LacA/LacB family sugar-phosphate isomerase